jgi:hypothetical protein
MTEGSNEGQEKPRYEAPELLSLGETMRGIAICEDGTTPSVGPESCTNGGDADESCVYGYYTNGECSYGYYP